MRSIDRDTCRADTRVGQTHVIKHVDRHDWTYYSVMSKDEVLLLKCWDSEGTEGRARYSELQYKCGLFSMFLLNLQKAQEDCR